MYCPNSSNFKPNRNLVETQRLEAKDGAVQRVLGKRNTIFSPEYKEWIFSNPEHLLSAPYLLKELKSMKRMMTALMGDKRNKDAIALFEQLRRGNSSQNSWSILCAVGRHLHARDMLRDLDSVMFEDVVDQWSMETIIHGIATTLDEIPEIIAIGRASFSTIRKQMDTHEAGLVEAGAFEPDLRHIDDYNDRPALIRLCEEAGWDFPVTGGFVVASHRLVRVIRKGLYKRFVRAEFPGYMRVKNRSLYKTKSLKENAIDILEYAWKQQNHIQDIDRIKSTKCHNSTRVLFLGPTTDKIRKYGFNSDEMIRRYCLFLDSAGFEMFEINSINIYARAWFGKNEIKAFNNHGVELNQQGYYNIEPRRMMIEDSPSFKKSTKHEQDMMLFHRFQMNRLGRSPTDKPYFDDTCEVKYVAGLPMIGATLIR